MESQGYEVQAYSIPAEAVGALHQRERIWIVASHPNKNYIKRKPDYISEKKYEVSEWSEVPQFSEPVNLWNECSHSLCAGRGTINTPAIANDFEERVSRYFGFGNYAHGNFTRNEIKSSIIRMLNGLPEGLDYTKRYKRISALGNAVVPPLVYEIFKCIDKINQL